MTVPAQTPEARYLGDGVTVAWDFPFRVDAAEELEVRLDGALEAGWTATGYGEPLGGTVTLAGAPANGVRVNLRRVMLRKRETTLVDGALAAAALNSELDRMTMALQNNEADLARGLRAPVGDVDADLELPLAADRAGRVLLFDDDGNPTVGALTLISLGLGTLALQNSDAVGISGGAINGVALAGCTFEGQVNDVILGGTIDANGQPIIDALLNDPIIESGAVQTVLVLPGGGSVTSDGIGVGVPAQPGLSFYGTKTAANNTLSIETITSGEAKLEVIAQGAVQGDVVTDRGANGLSLRNRSNGPLGFHTNDTRRINIDNVGRVNVGNVDNAYGAQLEVMLTGAPNCLALGRFSNDSSRARMVILKSRGAAVGAHGLVQAGDPLGELAFAGSTGAAYAFGASITVEAEGTPGASSMGARMRFALTPDGGTSAVEFLRADNTGALTHRNNATTIFTAASHLGLRSYTVATLPAAAAAGEVIRVSDGTGNKRLAISDAAGAANWRFPDGNLVS